MDPVSKLESLGLKVTYAYSENPNTITCRVTVNKDMSQFDCYGIGKIRNEAKKIAAQRMVALLNLLFPIVPISLFGRPNPLDFKFYKVEFYNSSTKYDILSLTELKGKFYLYVEKDKKTYTILPTFLGTGKPEKPICPIDLLNEPIRHTDWSNGPISLAQEAYLSRRLELYYS
jgi:hypothetical protein